MSDWIDEWREEGIHPLMGTCPICKRVFVQDEGMNCNCLSEVEGEEEEEDERCDEDD